MKKLFCILVCLVMICELSPGSIAAGQESETPANEEIITAEFSEELPLYSWDNEKGRFRVVEEYVDKISLVPDEKLFGDYADGEWIKKPLLNYDAFEALEDVKNAAMEANGDYTLAKEELLDYYRLQKEKNWAEPEDVNMTGTDLLTTKLLKYNVLSATAGANVVAEFNLQSDKNGDSKVSIDLFENRSNTITLLRSVPAFEIVAAKKDGSTGSLVRWGNDAPRLVLMINGEEQVLKATAAGTIRAGKEIDTVFNDKDNDSRLIISESSAAVKKVTTVDTVIEDYHSPTPVDENTARTLIKFDLSKIAENQNITSARLELTGSTDADSARPYILYVSNNSMWEEDTLNWKSKEHYIMVSDGEPYTRFYLPWQEKFSRAYRDNMQRFATFLPQTYQVYMETGNDEYAYLALTQMCGFFDQLGNVPDMAYTGQENTYTSSKYGRNSLDVGSRMQRFVKHFWAFIDSKYMTAEIWTSFIKYIYRSGECLYQEENYHPNNNWGAIETLGLFIASYYAEELADSAKWLDMVDERIYVADQVGDDMASIEVPLTYAGSTTLTSLFEYHNMAKRIGKDYPYPEEVEKQLTNLFKYLMYASGPGFVALQMGDDNTHKYNILIQPEKFAEKFPEPEIIWGATDKKEGKAPVFTSHRYLSNRNYIMRTGWDDNDLFLETNMNAGFKNHGHNDDLGIIVFAHGEYLLADCGYDNLNYGTETNTWLSSSRAHNTVEINDKSQVMDKVSLGTEHEWVTNDSYDYFRGTTSRNPDAEHTRSILFVRDGFWIVNDYLQPRDMVDANNPDAPNPAESENKYVQRWHAQPTANLTIDETTKTVRTNFDNANIQIVPVNVNSYSKSEIVKDGYYSETRGKLTYADYVEYEQKKSGNAIFSTVLVPESTAVNKNISTEEILLSNVKNNGAAAMRITITDRAKATDSTYYVLNDMSQKALRDVGSYKTDATMMYVEKDKNGFTKIYAQDAMENAEGLSILNSDGTPLLKTEKKLPQISVEYNGDSIKISTGYDANQVDNEITYKNTDLSTLSIYAPNYTGEVLLNGVEQSFYKKEGYLYLGEGETDEVKPTFGGGGGGSGGGGSGGGSADKHGTPEKKEDEKIPVEPTTDPEKEKLKESVKGHWAETELTALINDGVIKGDNGDLKLADEVTRAEFVTMLQRALKEEVTEYKGKFSDISEGDWYAPSIGAALNKNWISGYEDNTFRPNFPITREQMALICANVIKCTASQIDTDFTDSKDLSDWSADAVAAIVKEGLMSGYPDKSFRPKEKTPREQAMVMVYRIKNYIEKEQSK